MPAAAVPAEAEADNPPATFHRTIQPRPDEPLPAREDPPVYKPPDDEELSKVTDRLTAARATQMRQLLARTDAERRLTRCVDMVLSNDELPWNPFPLLARLVRREEMALVLEQKQQADAHAAAAARGANASRALWREGGNPSAPPELAKLEVAKLLKGWGGAAWRLIAPMVDAEAIKELSVALGSSQLLSGTAARTVQTSDGNFTVKSVCSLAGGHAFGGRLVPRPRTIIVREHVLVKGKGGRLESALSAFAEHICSSALALHATKDHFVEKLEVYTGDDVFDDDVGPDDEMCTATFNARGSPERFGLAALHKRDPLLTRALHAAAISQLPVALHALVCIPVFDRGAADGLPPRWEFAAAQKTYCFFYESSGGGGRTPASRASRSSAAESYSAADEPAAGAGGFEVGGFQLERPPTPPPKFQPYPLQSLYESVFLTDADALWYLGLTENETSPEVGTSQFVNEFHAFVGEQACKFLIRCDYPNLAEALLLLVPGQPRDEREPLLAELTTWLSSDAAALGAHAHGAHVLARVIEAIDGPAVPEPKRRHASAVLGAQFQALRDQMVQLTHTAHWTDVAPLKNYCLDTLSECEDARGELRLDARSVRELCRLRRTCDALEDVLCDSLIACSPLTNALISTLWVAKRNEVPVAFQPLPTRVKVVVQSAEVGRQRKMHAYPASILKESIVLQYAVDTGLDKAISSAFADFCSARVLSTNPMHAVLERVKSAAQLFELWKETDASLHKSLANKVSLVDLAQGICRVPAAERPASPTKQLVRPKARWGMVSKEVKATHVDNPLLAAIEEDGVVYGVRGSLIAIDYEQLLKLRDELGDLVPHAARMVVQEYESLSHTCFCGEMLLHGRYASLAELQSISLREDHFITGPKEEHALLIHCQRVIQRFLRLHHKTPHLAASLDLGDERRWRVPELLEDQRAALAEVLGFVKAGGEPKLSAYVLLRGLGAPRYVAFSKSFHLIFQRSAASLAPLVRDDASDCSSDFGSEDSEEVEERRRREEAQRKAEAEAAAAAARCWPARTTQVFDSVFLSRAHIDMCLNAESGKERRQLTVGSWRHKKWQVELEEGARDAMAAGSVYNASRRLLQLHLNRDDRSLLPVVGRLLNSTSSKLDGLSQLCATMQGVLECGRHEELRAKVDQKVLASMFEGYRLDVLHVLSSDACCNFEALRGMLQGYFQWVLEHLREQGLLVDESEEVLETIDDYLRCVELSTSVQVVRNDTALVNALSAHTPSTAHNILRA